MNRIFIFMILILPGGVAPASDLVREQRITEEIEEAILVGEAVRLKAGDIEFLAIHAEAETPTTKGAVILLHGRGAHPNWTDVIQPLRSELPRNGWETLSLQMPVASVEASEWAWSDLIPEAFPRIKAGIEFLKQRKISNITLLGHSMGARMAAEFLAAEEPNEVSRFAAIGLPANRKEPESGTLGALKKIRMPLLDIYGSQDISPVLDSARARSAAARKAENSRYRQVEVAGADHFFSGLDDTLLARVRAWLGRSVTGER